MGGHGLGKGPGMVDRGGGRVVQVTEESLWREGRGAQQQGTLTPGKNPALEGRRLKSGVPLGNKAERKSRKMPMGALTQMLASALVPARFSTVQGPASFSCSPIGAL